MPKISDLSEVTSLVDTDEFLVLDGDQNRRISSVNVFGSVTTDYQTRAAAIAANIPVDVDAIRTRGYATAGDGGGAVYKRIATPAPVEAWHFQSADGSYWELVRSPDFNVRQLGAAGDGVSDDSAAFQAAVDSAASISTSWPVQGGLSSNSTVVFISDGTYVLNTKVSIPETKGIAWIGESAWGARILWGGAGDYAFSIEANVGGTFRANSFKGLCFDSGGIEIAGNARGLTEFVDCVFADCGDYPIKGLGASIVGGIVRGCKFSGNAGAISLDYQDSDLWVIEKNNFVRSSATDILLNTTGVTIRDNDFETRATTSATSPWIQTKVGETRILSNRFGDEIDTGYAPPRDAILVGLDAATSTIIPDVLITQNSFRGTNGTPSSTECDSCVRINGPVRRLKFVGNFFAEGSDYNTAILKEDYLSLGNDARLAGSNIAADNEFPVSFTSPLFDAGGVAFNVTGPIVGQGNPYRALGNLLRVSNDLTDSLWIKNNCTVAKDAIGPDVASNTACTITKTAGSGGASVRTQAIGTASNLDGYLTFSCGLKAGTLGRARLYLVNTTDNYTIQSSEVINLPDDWQRFSYTFANIDSAKTYFAYIAIGSDTAVDDALTGTILVHEPMLNHGPKAAPFVLPNIHTGGTNHADLPWQGLMLGSAHFTYGASSPGSGRYEVGDICWNNEPAAGESIGWVCTSAGSPGTWTEFGTIDGTITSDGAGAFDAVELELTSGTTVAGLPTPSVGMIRRVTDANSPSIGSTVTGGGAAFALVTYNGSNWTVIGI